MLNKIELRMLWMKDKENGKMPLIYANVNTSLEEIK